jgi:hypothetical protein
MAQELKKASMGSASLGSMYVGFFNKKLASIFNLIYKIQKCPPK